MKKYLKALTLILIVSLIALCGCKSETEEAANHERPIFNLCYSINHNDSSTYLSCFTPPAKKAYISSDSGSKDIVSDLLNKNGLEANEVSCEIIGKRELASAERQKLQRSYKKEYSKNDEIEKAFLIDVCFNSSKGSDIRKITVVLIDNNWYIYGEVITNFKFGK